MEAKLDVGLKDGVLKLVVVDGVGLILLDFNDGGDVEVDFASKDLEKVTKRFVELFDLLS